MITSGNMLFTINNNKNSFGHFLNQKDEHKIPTLKEFTGYQGGKEGIYDFTEELISYDCYQD